jgi:hypothetical protein
LYHESYINIQFFIYCYWQNSSVGIVARLLAARQRNRGSIPGMTKKFPLSIASILTLESTQPHMPWVPAALSAGVKRAEREGDHLILVRRLKMRGATAPTSVLMACWLNTGTTSPSFYLGLISGSGVSVLSSRSTKQPMVKWYTSGNPPFCCKQK